MLKVKSVFRCDEEFKSTFQASTCLLTISVGQEAHEAEKLYSTIALVDQSFKACVMLIDDTLQRHTMAIETDVQFGDELLFASLQAGDSWLKRNEKIYTQMQIPLSIIRWNDWLNHKDYLSYRSKLLETCANDISYKEKFEETIDQFLERYSRRAQNNYLIDDRARKLCLEYLLEECTAMCLWPELQCEYEVYPGYRNAAMDETHRRFVLPAYPSLLHAVRVKFKNRGQFSAQVFEFLEKVVDNSVSFQAME